MIVRVLESVPAPYKLAMRIIFRDLGMPNFRIMHTLCIIPTYIYIHLYVYPDNLS